MAQRLFHMEVLLFHVAQTQFHVEKKLFHMERSFFHMEKIHFHVSEKLFHVEKEHFRSSRSFFHVAEQLIHMETRHFQLEKWLGQVEMAVVPWSGWPHHTRRARCEARAFSVRLSIRCIWRSISITSSRGMDAARSRMAGSCRARA